MRTAALLIIALLVLALAADGNADTLSKKKHKKHVSSTSTTTTTTTTTTTSTARPMIDTTTAQDTDYEDYEDTADEDDIPFIDNLDIIKIHVPLPPKEGPGELPEPPPQPPIIVTNGSKIIINGNPQIIVTGAPEIVTAAPEISETGAPEVVTAGHPEIVTGAPEIVTTGVPEVVTGAPEIVTTGAPEVVPTGTAEVAPTSPEPPAPDAGNTVLIPDVATFDAVFANRSRLADDIRVFTFGGVYQIIVNRTRNSVEVVMVKQLGNATHGSGDGGSTGGGGAGGGGAHGGHLQMMVRAPSVTGRRQASPSEDDQGEDDQGDQAEDEQREEGEDEQGDQEEDEQEETREDDQRDDKQGDEGEDDQEETGEDDQGADEQGDEGEDEQGDQGEDEQRHQGEDERNKAGSGGDAASERPARTGHGDQIAADDPFDAVFINGSALSGVQLGVVTYNTSGVFRLNVSLADDFLTVVIAQVAQQMGQHDVAVPEGTLPRGGLRTTGPRRFRTQDAADQDGAAGAGGWLGTSVTVLVVAAFSVLAGAILVTRARARVGHTPFARRGEDYGTLEHGMDALTFYQLRS